MLIYSRPRLTVKPVSIVRMSMFTRLLAKHSDRRTNEGATKWTVRQADK